MCNFSGLLTVSETDIYILKPLMSFLDGVFFLFLSGNESFLIHYHGMGYAKRKAF